MDVIGWIKSQVSQSTLRTLAHWGAGALVSMGILTGEQGPMLEGIVLGIIALIFSIVSARHKSGAIAVVKTVAQSPKIDAAKVIEAAPTTKLQEQVAKTIERFLPH